MATTLPATTTRIFSKRRLAWATGAGLLGCGVACSLPAVLALALGSGFGASVAASLARAGGELTAGLAMFGTTLVAGIAIDRWRTRRKTNDGMVGCGCPPPGARAIFRSPKAASHAPIACTADLEDKIAIDEQMAGYREAFAALLRTEPLPNGFVWVFRANLETMARIERLARNEHECCSFFTFDVRTNEAGDEIRWSVTAAPAARPVLEALSELPQRLRSGATSARIKELATSAGLEFVADHR